MHTHFASKSKTLSLTGIIRVLQYKILCHVGRLLFGRPSHYAHTVLDSNFFTLPYASSTPAGIILLLLLLAFRFLVDFLLPLLLIYCYYYYCYPLAAPPPEPADDAGR